MRQQKWLALNESSLASEIEQKLFAEKNQKVVFLCKVIKRRYSYHAVGSDEKPQLLVVTHDKSTSNTLYVYRVNVHRKGRDLKFETKFNSLVLLSSLQAIDGSTKSTNHRKSEQTQNKNQNQNLNISLYFNNNFTYHCYTLTSKDKGILYWNLLQLCHRVLNTAPRTVGVNLAELRLLASKEKYEKRCKMLRSSNTDNVDILNGNLNLSYTPIIKDGTDVQRHVIASMMSNKSDNEDKSDKLLLAVNEEELLNSILVEEDLVEVAPDELPMKISDMITELDNDLCKELRSWEERNNQDPISLLVDQLENVESQLSELEGWMSNYNIELRKMRNGIRRIETENNRLNLQAKNHSVLRNQLGDIIACYSIDKNTTAVLEGMQSHLQRVQHDVEVEHDAEAESMFFLLNAADNLLAAIAGKGGSTSKETRAFMEEHPKLQRMTAITGRVAELNHMNERFCGFIDMFLEDRITYYARLKQNPSSNSKKLPLLHKKLPLHENLLGYRPLLSKLKQLDSSEYDKLLRTYVKEVSIMYSEQFKVFFSKMSSCVEVGKSFDSRLCSMPDCALNNYEEEKKSTQAVIRAAFDTDQAHSSVNSKVSCATAMKHCFDQILPLILREQDVLGKLFFDYDFDAEAEAEADADADGQAEDIQSQVCDLLSSMFITSDSFVLELDKLVQQVRQSNNNLEMLRMVVDVDMIVHDCQNKSDFIVGVLSNPQFGLKHSLQLAFNTFVDEQLSYIQHLTPDTRFCGVLAPVKKFPAFMDHLIGVWDICIDAVLKRKQGLDQTGMLAGNSVGIALQKTATTLLQWLDRSARSKEKYANIVRLENLYFFKETVGARHNQALVLYIHQATIGFSVAEEHYISWIVECQFPELLNFLVDVENLLETTDMSDVLYHKDREVFRKVLLATSADKVAAGIPQMRSRVTKHLSSGFFLGMVFENLKAFFLARYERFSEIALECYQEKLEFTLPQMEKLLGTHATH